MFLDCNLLFADKTRDIYTATARAAFKGSSKKPLPLGWKQVPDTQVSVASVTNSISGIGTQ
ncbi:conserved hypothetical protein [Roseibium sp. TrichSKD4]|nr:conserved hypothetical protein [Roseibium sp. TrichSKD4]